MSRPACLTDEDVLPRQWRSVAGVISAEWTGRRLAWIDLLSTEPISGAMYRSVHGYSDIGRRAEGCRRHDGSVRVLLAVEG